MKKIAFITAVAITIMTIATTYGQTPIDVKMTGAISHTEYKPDQTATITFNRFPTTLQEFQDVRKKIGGEPHGAVALQIMAYEMYRHDKQTGEACIRLNNTLNNVQTPISRLNELFGNDTYYARPYQIASYLKGATPENGYNPTKPYTIQVRVSKGTPYQESNDYQTKVLYLEVFTGGKDTPWNGISVLKTHKPDESSNGQYFIVFSSSSLYSQVKAVSFTTPFNGLDNPQGNIKGNPTDTPKKLTDPPKKPTNGQSATSSGPIDVKMTGTISHTDYKSDQTATITFNRFPATLQEFQEIRNQIGAEPHGAVALQIMAYEMYRRDKQTGEACIRLNNTLNNVQTPISRLNELFGNDAYYARPYQIASYLKGATPENGYNPTKPYTIQVRVSKGTPYQESNDYQTKVLYLEVFTGGKDSSWNGISVLKTHKPDEPSNGQYFIVFGSSSLYSQVKAVSFTAPFNGLD